MNYQNMSALSKKLKSHAKCVQKILGCKISPCMVLYWSTSEGEASWFGRKVSAQTWIRLGRNLNLHFFLLKPTFFLVQNLSQERIIGNHKGFEKYLIFACLGRETGTRSMQGTASTCIAQPASSPPADQSTALNCKEQHSCLHFSFQ